MNGSKASRLSLCSEKTFAIILIMRRPRTTQPRHRHISYLIAPTCEHYYKYKSIHYDSRKLRRSLMLYCVWNFTTAISFIYVSHHLIYSRMASSLVCIKPSTRLRFTQNGSTIYFYNIYNLTKIHGHGAQQWNVYGSSLRGVVQHAGQSRRFIFERFYYLRQADFLTMLSFSVNASAFLI